MKIWNLVFIILFIFTGIVPGLAADNITVTDPANDNPIITGDFFVKVNINDVNINSAQARITGYPWISLEQETSNVWSSQFKILDYPAGVVTLTAKYKKTGETIWYYTSSTTSVTLKPSTSIQYGKVTFTLKDNIGALVAGVTMQPFGNTTGTDGIINIVGQPLNIPINFTFTKPNYNPTFSLITFANNQTLNQQIVINSIGSQLKTFKVTGWDDLQIGRSVYVKVYDSITDLPIEGANITIYSGLGGVKALFGRTTSNGRVFAGITANNGEDYELSVDKSGYKDWSETFTVYLPKTPIPTVTPTPIPTVVPVITPDIPKKRDCNGIQLTDDDCKAVLVQLENIKSSMNKSFENQTLNSQIQNPAPIQTPGTNWILYIGFLALLGAIIYRFYIYKKPGEIQHIRSENEIMDDVNVFKSPAIPKKTIQCKLCYWSMEIPDDTSDTMISIMLQAHEKEKHGN